MKHIVFTLLLLFTASAHAAATFSWTPPVPVLGVTIDSYSIECGTASGVYVDTIIVTDGTATSHVVTTFPDGDRYCAMQASTSQGSQSGYSNEVAFTMEGGNVKKLPNAPGVLSVD
jgi:hypothetical protein